MKVTNYGWYNDDCIIIIVVVGTLCGECRDGNEGVSALLNECVSCHDASGLYILALSQ